MRLPADVSSGADTDRQASFVPDDMPTITNADLVEGIAEGGYIRGVMVEAQEPDSRKPSYALYILTSWRKGYSVFHIAWPARPRLFKDLDRVIEMLRFEFNYRGVISIRLAGEPVAQKSARLRTRPDSRAIDPLES